MVKIMNGDQTGYFHRVARQTPTRLWINNPTPAQAKSALQAGALGASTNPTYPARLVKEDPVYFFDLLDPLLEEHDDETAASLLYQRAVARLAKIYEPLFRQTQGGEGYVAIQGDPRVNDDPQAILTGAAIFYQLGENIIVKVPSTPAGAQAMESLTAMDRPTIGTLGFSIDQAIYMAEAYRRGLRKARKRPKCLLTYIAGILDEHLAETSERLGNVVPPEMIMHAGIVGTRRACQVFKERGYEAMLIGGGARGAHHFTELVGGDLYITIGWDLASRLIDLNGPVEDRIGAKTPDEILTHLEKHLPDFVRASRIGILEPEEFRSFGPTMRFQGSFLSAWNRLLDLVAKRRAERMAVR